MTVKVDYLPKGLTFTRLAIALAHSRGKEGPAANYAAQRWGDDSQVHRLLTKGGEFGLNGLLEKAAVPGGTSQSGSWAAELNNAESVRTEFFDLVRERSLLGKIPGLRRVPMQIRMVTEATGFTGVWVGEGQPVPVSSATYDEEALPMRKVAAMTVLSDELVEHNDPRSELFVRDQLVKACVETIDVSFIDPANAGTADVEPASITNGLTPHMVGTGDADDFRDVLSNAVDAFTGDLERAVWVGSPQLFLKLNGIGFEKVGLRGGELVGALAVPSKYLPNSGGLYTLVLVDPDAIAIGEDAMSLRASQEATVQMLDNPTNNTTTPTATNAVSLWQANATAIMATKFLNWDVRREGAVQLIAALAEASAS